MKTLLTILTLFLLQNSFAQTTYYISPDGSDLTGTGSEENPLKTLHKAAQVAVSGDTIFVMEGTYDETQEAVITEGVSIDGDGRGVAIINSTLNSSGHYAIKLASTSEGTDGNQFIRNITLTGSDLTALQGIYVGRRSNVHIYNCTIKNFISKGVYFEGQSVYEAQPSTYATGNKLYNDSIINCSDRGEGGSGMICIGGQDGLLVYDNYLNQTQRAPTHNGNIVFAVEGYNKNFKFYNNTSIKPDTDGANWNFHLETWQNEGGNEIYNNTFTGGVALDIGYYAAVKGTSDYSYSFHDNIVKIDNPQSSTDDSHATGAVDLETAGSDLYIYNNHFTNLAMPIALGGNPEDIRFDSIFIHNNIFENSGFSNSSWSTAIEIQEDPNDTLSNIKIENNTFYHSNKSKAGALIRFNSQSNAVIENVSIKNNILVNANTTYLLFQDSEGKIKDITVDNNIIYNNGNSNQPIYQGDEPDNITFTNTINADPLLNTTDFSLLEGSPAIGRNIGAVIDEGTPGPIVIITVPASDTTIYLGSPVTLNGSVESAAEHTSTYLWSVQSGTGTLDDATALNTSVSDLGLGVNTIRLTATQDDDQESYSERNITVIPVSLSSNKIDFKTKKEFINKNSN